MAHPCSCLRVLLPSLIGSSAMLLHAVIEFTTWHQWWAMAIVGWAKAPPSQMGHGGALIPHRPGGQANLGEVGVKNPNVK